MAILSQRRFEWLFHFFSCAPCQCLSGVPVAAGPGARARDSEVLSLEVKRKMTQTRVSSVFKRDRDVTRNYSESFELSGTGTGSIITSMISAIVRGQAVNASHSGPGHCCLE